MAGARNTEGANLDTSIDDVVTKYALYEAVAVAGENSEATKKYFFNSLFNKLQANANLKNHMRTNGYQALGFTPTGSAAIVTIDPNSVA